MNNLKERVENTFSEKIKSITSSTLGAYNRSKHGATNNLKIPYIFQRR